MGLHVLECLVHGVVYVHPGSWVSVHAVANVGDWWGMGMVGADV